MIPTTKSLRELTAADLMSRHVVTIPHRMSLRAAAHQLNQANVSGAPVTDDEGRCVGVLSRTDLVRWLDQGEGAARANPHGTVDFCCDWDISGPEDSRAEQVSRFMTTNLVTATPATPLNDLARWMRDAHIHRVVVTDDQGRPIGLVSATDVLAAVAREDPSATVAWAEG